jgi:integrase/recombinase XerD
MTQSRCPRGQPSRAAVGRQLHISNAAQAWLARFDRDLAEAGGLTQGTRYNYGHEAALFVHWLFGRRPLRWQRLQARSVIRFVVTRAQGLRRTTARRLLAVAVRRFLRFLSSQGVCAATLVGAVPRFAPWPRAPLPQGLSQPQCRQLLAAFDRSTAAGRRDYALTLCMLETGLRVGEAARLTLEQLDWHRGVLCLPENKSRRERVLPLPPKVGRALAAYLQAGRPASALRQVFLADGPVRPLSQANARWRLCLAFARSGLPVRGTHVLRRTFATRLHQAGASLKEVADWLGHRHLNTTAAYAWVNLKELRQVVLPWPEHWR